MKSVAVRVSFAGTLLDKIDAEARRESRSRSELIGQAARQYVERQNRWRQLFAHHVRKPDTGLLEDRAFFEHTTFAATAARSNPRVALKFSFAIDGFDCIADAIVQIAQIRDDGSGRRERAHREAVQVETRDTGRETRDLRHDRTEFNSCTSRVPCLMSRYL